VTERPLDPELSQSVPEAVVRPLAVERTTGERVAAHESAESVDAGA
jgi:hypothetical protein